MSKTNDGGNAFPCPSTFAPKHSDRDTVGSPGMSLRDWFAGQALAGFMAFGVEAAADSNPEDLLKATAATIYAFADAMLAQREKDTEK